MPTEVYGVGWNADDGTPTKDAVYDKIEMLGAAHDAVTVVGDALSLSTQQITPHANLEAIADAEDGVTNPGITIYDDNGAVTGTAFIYGTTVDDNKDVVMSIGVEEEGSETPAVYVELDGINGTVDILKPLTAPMISGGLERGSYTQADTPVNISETVCEKFFYQSSSTTADVTYNLPATGFCDAGLTSVRKFLFVNGDNVSGSGDIISDMIIEPDATDTIWILGTGACTAGFNVVCDGGAARNSARVTGQGAAVWLLELINGSTCACGS